MNDAGNKKSSKVIPWSVGIITFVIAEVAMAYVFFVSRGPANDAIEIIMMFGCFCTSPFCVAIGIAAGWFVRREINRSSSKDGASVAIPIDCAGRSDGAGIPW